MSVKTAVGLIVVYLALGAAVLWGGVQLINGNQGGQVGRTVDLGVCQD